MKLVLHLILLSLAVALPPGFVDEGVARIRSGAGANFFPNNQTGGFMLFVAVKEGSVFALEDPDNSDKTRLVMNITSEVCSNGERGLQSIVPHPDFASNRWMYMFYTSKRKGVDGPSCQQNRESGPRNRLSRVKVSRNNNVDLSTEEILMETSPLEYDHHNGGAMAFGNDGYLYVAIGNGGSRRVRVAQDLGDTLGKIIRLTEDGEIPAGNPYMGSDSARCHINGIPPAGSPSGTMCQEIWSSGLRNPFRFVMDPNTTDHVRFYVNDVGGAKWEEISEGGTQYEAANYGWPYREGPCSLGSFDDCADPPQDLVDPLYWYAHNNDGGAVTGGAFVPPGLWPPELELDGRYLFNEFVNGVIHVLREGADPCRDCSPPIPAFTNETFHQWPRLVDLFFGPYKDTQALYYTAREGRINLRRIVYVGGDNAAPTAIIQANITAGPVGTVVKFDGSSSFDPNDGDELTYEWDFQGYDGSVQNEVTTTIVFDQAGTHTATLTVSDDMGFKGVAFVDIIIGTPPAVEIISPAAGSRFAVGDVFTLLANGTDENGVLDDDSFVWEVRQHHNTHFHPFVTYQRGNNFTMPPAPEPEDFLAAVNSYLEVVVYATGLNGLTTESSRFLQPKLVLLQFDSSPAGITLTLDEHPITTPAVVLSWENHLLRASVPNDDNYRFESWSDGGNEASNHNIRVFTANETVPLRIVARLQEVTPSSTPSDYPSSLPSDYPSTLPSDIPSGRPSGVPTFDSPSSLPSESGSPSDLASMTLPPAPSAVPSIFWPSMGPTERSSGRGAAKSIWAMAGLVVLWAQL